MKYFFCLALIASAAQTGLLQADCDAADGYKEFEAVGVKAGSSNDDIKVAWKKLAGKYHPDKAKPEEKNIAECKMQAINAARDGLLEKKPPVHQSVQGGLLREQLIRAIQSGDKSHIEELINSGADVNDPGIYGRTPLLEAVENGDINIIEMILNKGADIDAKNTGLEITALMRAIMRRSKDVVEMLLRRGADVSVKNNQGETALEFAERLVKDDRLFDGLSEEEIKNTEDILNMLKSANKHKRIAS